MGDEESKRLILTRRSRFIAAALASVAAVAQAGACSPQPCLEPPAPPPDAGRDASGKDSGAIDPPVGDAGEPQPCLTTVPPDAETQ